MVLHPGAVCTLVEKETLDRQLMKSVEVFPHTPLVLLVLVAKWQRGRIEMVLVSEGCRSIQTLNLGPVSGSEAWGNVGLVCMMVIKYLVGLHLQILPQCSWKDFRNS